MARIGFIGLGNIGLPMARRLRQAGNELAVFDVRREPCAEFLAGGKGVAASARQVGDEAEIVFLSLPTPEALREVAGGNDALAGGTRVKLVVDLSTVGPQMAREAAKVFQARGIEYVDSPVSGGVAGAEKGTLAVMVACSADSFERLRPVLQAIGRPIHVGVAPGLAQMLKVLNNFLSATAMAATAEAMALGVKGGLDPAVMLEVFNASSGRNTATTDKFPRSVLDRSFNYGFRAVLLHKDVKLCKTFADSFDKSLGLVTTMEKVWAAAAAELGDGDFTRIVELAERPLGVTVGRKGASS
ncbi:MAG: NAD(P)-dependent oxidoreductase [Betaproteobacteria bacterium]|nr:NAD(P)-dependent oxidoreductase [Betaproteobacteria bacterium]